VIGGKDGFAMILMPLVVLLPITGLPVFWAFPFGEELPIYLFFVFLFSGMMWVMHRTMNYPRMTGAESLMGKTAEVVSRTSLGYGPPYMVRILGELWSADSNETLHIGEKVTVICVQGNSVLVKHGNGSPE
jgi:membrane protein implicated in regulation of membrane protease activity